jgi:peptidoglycan/LPS O-acetylase OafA/YrhL
VNYRPFGIFRTMLALLVLAQHIGFASPPGVELGPWMTGSTAVLAFFALSGFVITEAAERFYRGRPGAFVVNRAIRIAPQYLLALLLSVSAVALVIALRPGFIPNTLIDAPASELFTLRNLVLNVIAPLPGTKDLHSFVPYAWALRAEIVFYVLLAGTIWLAARSRWAYSALAGAGVAIFAIFLAGGPPLLHFVPYFALGVTAYFATVRRSLRLYAVVAALFAVCMWSALAISITPYGATPFTVAQHAFHAALLATLLLAPLVLARIAVAERWRKLDRRIGDLSYPLYLQQYVVLVLGAAFLPPSWLTMAAVVIAALAVAWLSDLTLEGFLRRIRDRVRGRKLEVRDLKLAA